jgi:hypothetical protein
LPSITATHELVVPRSMPMTSSARSAEDTLRRGAQGGRVGGPFRRARRCMRAGADRGGAGRAEQHCSARTSMASDWRAGQTAQMAVKTRLIQASNQFAPVSGCFPSF